MKKSIAQDMEYRQSLMKYAEKYGVSRAGRKYNKSRSYIYFRRQRRDGNAASLAHNHTATQTGTPRKKSGSSAICAAEIPR